MKGLLKDIEILSLFMLKPLINKLKKSPIRFIVTTLIVLGLFLFPFLFLENRNIQIRWGKEIFYFDTFLSIILLLAVVMKKRCYVKSEKIKLLCILSGDIHKAFYIYQWDVYLKQVGIYLLIGVICLLKIKIQIVDVLYIVILFLMFLKWAMDAYYLSFYFRKSKSTNGQIVISFLLLLFVQFIFMGISNWFPTKIMILLCVILQMFIISSTKKKVSVANELKYFDILKDSKVEWTKGKGFQLIYNFCRILAPENGIYIAKEILQILNETIPLVSANMMTIIVSIIMVVATPLISQDALKMGMVISISYFAFLIGLNTFPREMKYLWVVKSVGVSIKRLAQGKIIGCLLMGCVGSILYGMIYCLIGSVFLHISGKVLLPILGWAVVTAVPIGCSLGIIAGCCVPYQIMEKEKEIDYKYNGLESSFLFFIIFLVAIPTLVSGGFLYDINLIILKVIYFFLMFFLLVKSTRMLVTKMIKNE